MLTAPDFRLPTPNPRTDNTTDAAWWIRCHLLALEATTRDSGTFASKPGFHGRGRDQVDKGVNNSGTNYSIRDAVNRMGPWWQSMSSGFDWTFTTAQNRDYTLIDKYTSRLVDSSLDQNDPRLDLVLFEFYGQADWDSEVEGRNEFRETDVTSDASHLWHLHFSFLRSAVGDFWAMWALYTVLIGWTVDQWRASLPGAPPPPPPSQAPAALPFFPNGLRVLSHKNPMMTGTDVLYVQKFIGPAKMGAADGKAGPNFHSGVRWYQRMRGLRDDGFVGRITWAHMGVRR